MFVEFIVFEACDKESTFIPAKRLQSSSARMVDKYDVDGSLR